MIKLKNILTEESEVIEHRLITMSELMLYNLPEIKKHCKEIIITEDSKNDPIQELNKHPKNLAIFLFGPPASGKSTFIKQQIYPKTGNIKIINPDDISDTLRKHKNISDPNVYIRGSKEKAVQYFKNILLSGNNVIFDTTGNDFNVIFDLVNEVKRNNYTYIFIHMLAPENQGKKSNTQRDRNVDIDYLEKSYKKTQGLIKYFTQLDPESYYIIVNIDNNYSYYKFDHGKLLKKKGNQYK